VFVGLGDDRLACVDVDAMLFQPFDLGRVVRHQSNGPDAQQFYHFSSDVVFSEVVVEAEVLVRLNCVQPLLLKSIGPNFVGQPNASTFLPHVKQRAEIAVAEVFQRLLELFSAVALQTCEDVSGHALAVKAGGDTTLAPYGTFDERDVFLVVFVVPEGEDVEFPVTGWQHCPPIDFYTVSLFGDTKVACFWSSV
jgi:hypothetical protein